MTKLIENKETDKVYVVEISYADIELLKEIVSDLSENEYELSAQDLDQFIINITNEQ